MNQSTQECQGANVPPNRTATMAAGVRPALRDQASTPAPRNLAYVPKNAPHQFLNMGEAPYDVVVVMLK